MTPEGTKLRCADGVEDAARGRVVCVVEDHSKEGVEASNYVAAVGKLIKVGVCLAPVVVFNSRYFQL